MLHDSPLRTLHDSYASAIADRATSRQAAVNRPGAATGQKKRAEVEYIPYGTADVDGTVTCELVGTFGEVELEYAAIRRGAGLFDASHRGTVQLTGDATARREFLNRMLTQELKDLAPGIARRAFWLNRKGRIDADLLVMELGNRTLIDVDVHQAARTAESLNEFIIAEDVNVQDVSSQFHHIAVHGNLAHATIAAACGIGHFALERSQVQVITIDNISVVIARNDHTGETGYELIVPYDQAAGVWEFLLAADHIVGEDKHRVRPIGWHAFNIARIEAGTPLFNIDFGSTNLPHETGVLRERVSFAKGCYLGQEVVARMENLGKPKQTLVGLRMSDDLLPVADGQVFAKNDDGSMGDEIGVVTSSTLSPMLGSAPIAFAMLKTAKAALGNAVLANAEGEQATAVVSPLQFWPPPAAPGAA